MQHTAISTRFLLALTIAALLGAMTPRVQARQSDNDLRRQNQELATRIQDLEEELKAKDREIDRLKDQISELRQRLDDLRRAPRPATRPAAPEPEKVTIDESIPGASPRALFRAVRESYDKATANLDMGRPGDGRRRAFLKKLEGWKSSVDREFRGPITWHVRVIDTRDQDIHADRSRELVVTLQAVDPETDVKLGEPFDVPLSRALADRLTRYGHRGDVGVLVLRGILSPNIRINEERTERGSFDNPPFIGPFAEFGYAIEAHGLKPVEEDRKEHPAPTTKPASR
jgi:hypothetical protein